VDSETLDDASAAVFSAVVPGDLDVDEQALSDAARMDALARIRKKFGASVDRDASGKAVAAAFAIRLLAPIGLVDSVDLLRGTSGSTAEASSSGPTIFGHNVRFNFESEKAIRKVVAPRSDPPPPQNKVANRKGAAGAAGVGSLAPAPAQSAAAIPATVVDATWLKTVCETALPQMPIPEREAMCISVYEQLSSGKSDDLLQNDLFELLGFERFDLIQTLLGHRDRIIAATVDAMAVSSSNRSSSPKLVRPKRGVAAMVQSTITIQSAEEKEALKALRREEKKAARDAARGGGAHADLKAALGFDPERLRAQRAEEAQKAANAPLFTSKRGRQQPKEQCVFYSSF
jgi:hypothetical protein